MKNIPSANNKIQPAEQIAESAIKGEDISKHFTNQGRMRPPAKKTHFGSAQNIPNDPDADTK